jgi:hypothetical protein|tara:strand:- start:818 stop:1495 length:678 start_codon:yes stop_codon:yes gene_type:complete
MPTTFIVLLSASFVRPFGGLPIASRRTSDALTMSAIAANNRAAQQQKAEFYAMAPWEKKPTFEIGGRPTTLDLRAFIKPFDRDGVKIAAVFANQAGLPEIRTGGGRTRAWRCIGVISAPDDETLSAAVARQRKLITAWACELVADFNSGEKLLRTGAGAPPIELAWSLPPNGFKKMIQPSYQGELNLVPQSVKGGQVRCGFIGTPSRSYRSERNLMAFTKVELKS